MADQDALIIALHVDQQRLFGLGDFKGDGQAHQLRHVLEEFLRADGGGILFRQQQLIRFCADAEETLGSFLQHLNVYLLRRKAHLRKSGHQSLFIGFTGRLERLHWSRPPDLSGHSCSLSALFLSLLSAKKLKAR